MARPGILVLFLTLEERLILLPWRMRFVPQVIDFHFFCVWVCDLCIGLYIFCIVYIYMHMGAHVFGCVYTSVCTYEGLKLSRIIISCSSHFVHSGKGTQSHTELTDTASLACQFAERLPSLGWDDRQNPYHITRQLPHFEDPNTSPQTCLASI